MKHSHTVPAKRPHEKPQFQNNILSGSRLCVFIPLLYLVAHVIRSKEYHGKIGVSMSLEFLYDRPTFIRLLMQNYRLKTKFLDKTGHRCFNSIIMTMDNEHLAGFLPCPFTGCCRNLRSRSFGMLYSFHEYFNQGLQSKNSLSDLGFIEIRNLRY